MDTNTVSQLSQMSGPVMQVITTGAAFFSALAVVVAALGRIVHARRTGNAPVSAVMNGTNSPSK